MHKTWKSGFKRWRAQVNGQTLISAAALIGVLLGLLLYTSLVTGDEGRGEPVNTADAGVSNVAVARAVLRYYGDAVPVRAANGYAFVVTPGHREVQLREDRRMGSLAFALHEIGHSRSGIPPLAQRLLIGARSLAPLSLLGAWVFALLSPFGSSRLTRVGWTLLALSLIC